MAERLPSRRRGARSGWPSASRRRRSATSCTRCTCPSATSYPDVSVADGPWIGSYVGVGRRHADRCCGEGNASRRSEVDGLIDMAVIVLVSRSRPVAVLVELDVHRHVGAALRALRVGVVSDPRRDPAGAGGADPGRAPHAQRGWHLAGRRCRLLARVGLCVHDPGSGGNGQRPARRRLDARRGAAGRRAAGTTPIEPSTAADDATGVRRGRQGAGRSGDRAAARARRHRADLVLAGRRREPRAAPRRDGRVRRSRHGASPATDPPARRGASCAWRPANSCTGRSPPTRRMPC